MSVSREVPLQQTYLQSCERVEEGKLVLGKSETNIISPYLHPQS